MPNMHPLNDEGFPTHRPKIITEAQEQSVYTPIIKVTGIGGAGGNAINRMMERNLNGVDFIALNTDGQDLNKCQASIRLQIGHHLTKGLGAGGDPSAGERAAMEDAERIREVLEGAHMLFLTAGLGGGTGSGATPIVAQLLRQSSPDTLMVGVVSMPFSFEGSLRLANATRALEQLKKHVDAFIVIPNDNLFQIANGKLSMKQAFSMADEILYKAISSLTDIIVHTGYINIDFADVYNVLKGRGRAVFGVGSAEGEDRALKAVQSAINCPLLENSSIESATNVLLNISGPDLTLIEVKEACDYIQNLVGPGNAQLFFGFTERDDIKGFNITIIAAGFHHDEPTIDVERADVKEVLSSDPFEPVKEPVPEPVTYGPSTPTPSTLERVFEAPQGSSGSINTDSLRSPAIQRRKKYRFPHITSKRELESES